MILFFSGEGTIQENNTNLDLTQPKNITFRTCIEKQSEKQALQTIKRFKTIRNRYLWIWGSHSSKISIRMERAKKNWSKQFRKAQVSVHTKLTIRRVGLTGPPLQLKKNEMKNKEEYRV